jgi:hypothetical protein
MRPGFVGSYVLGPGRPAMRADTRENPVGKNGVMTAGHGGPSPEPVGCRWTARAASSARAGRRVPAGGWIGNDRLGGLPRASNSRLRTGTDKGNLTV